jgi:hypothetical protein
MAGESLVRAAILRFYLSKVIGKCATGDGALSGGPTHLVVVRIGQAEPSAFMSRGTENAGRAVVQLTAADAPQQANGR